MTAARIAWIVGALYALTVALVGLAGDYMPRVLPLGDVSIPRYHVDMDRPR